MLTALRTVPGKRRAISVSHGANVRNVRGGQISTVSTQVAVPTPGAWTALDGSGNPTGIDTGNWAQIIVDSNGAGSGGFADDWARWSGTAWEGSFDYWSPGTGQTGYFREWAGGDVTWHTPLTYAVLPSVHLKVHQTMGAEITLRDTTVFGPLLQLYSVSGCVIRITNCEGMHGRARSSGAQAAIQEMEGCQNNLFILDDVWSPGCTVRTDRGNGSRVISTNVRGMSLFHDMGVGYCGGRNTMSRNIVWEGEYIVEALAAGLAGTGHRVRLYWDDFASWQTAQNLVLTADAGDGDVWSGGGSNNTILTAGTHWDEDRSAFTTEYNTWFPSGAIANIWPPLNRVNNSAAGGFTAFPGA